jgi:sigma-B regulation protein RsbU (phosphoserine phosphatase)
MKDKPWTVLVVDDEPVNLRILQAFLVQAGFEVLTAQHGPQARQIAVEYSPDLILLDIMMPEEDGFLTCTRLKEDVHTAQIPVIFLSALDDEQSKVQGFHVGGVDYITKPFYQEEVMVRVKTHLKLRQTYEQLIAEQARRLDQVKEGQHQLLVQPEDQPEAGYGVHYAPCYEAGGDFYDVFPVNLNTYAYFVGDISGHDLSASLITAAVKALVREYFSPLYSAQESLGHINKVLRQSFFHQGRHMTAVCLLLDRYNNKGSIVSAAHPPLIHVPRDSESQAIGMNGDVLGLFDQVHICQRSVEANAGDRFLLYSDGLIDNAAQNMNREKGLEALLRICNHLAQETDIQNFVQGVVQELASQRQQDVADDIVALGVEV